MFFEKIRIQKYLSSYGFKQLSVKTANLYRIDRYENQEYITNCYGEFYHSNDCVYYLNKKLLLYKSNNGLIKYATWPIKVDSFIKESNIYKIDFKSPSDENGFTSRLIINL